MVPLNKLYRKYYDCLVGSERDFKTQINWFDKLFKKYHVKTVLDCGCGTGTHSIMLAKKGYKVTAFDYSKNQLKQAKEKARKEKIKIDFKQGDIRNFNFGKFDAVISLWSVIMFACKNKKELTSAIKCIKNSLNQKGIGFFETCTSRMLKNSKLELAKYIDKNVIIIRAGFKNYNKKQKSADVKFVYLTREKNEDIQITRAYAKHKYFDKTDIVPIISKLNLKLIDLYGSFIKENKTYEKFNKNSIFISPLFRLKNAAE